MMHSHLILVSEPEGQVIKAGDFLWPVLFQRIRHLLSANRVSPCSTAN
jgi:hypothetical protein